MAKRGYRFEVESKVSTRKQHVHIKIISGNNEITLSGETQSNAADCHETVDAICEGIVTMLRENGGRPKYTVKSLKPAAGRPVIEL